MTKIKICGLKLREDVEFISSLDVDYAGMIFVENVRRKISEIEAEEISNNIHKLNNAPKLVGLFADQPENYVLDIFNRYSLNYVQLCGNENLEYLSRLGIPFIKQIKIGTNINLKKICDQIDSIRALNGQVSLDTYKKGYYGGSGQLINLSHAEKIVNKYDVFLSGGLNSDNIINIIESIHPWAVDVSSGVETNNVKDKLKIEKFVNNIRSLKN